MKAIITVLLAFFSAGSIAIAAPIGGGQESAKQKFGNARSLKLLLDSAKIYSKRSPRNGISFANEALAIARQNNDESGEAYALFYLAACYANDYSLMKGIENYQLALSKFEELNNLEYICKSCIKIGGNYNQISEYKQAIPYLTRALSLSRKNDYEKLIDIYNGISYSYIMLGDYAKAIENAMKSLNSAERQGDRRKTAYLLNNIANIYQNWKEYDQALVYLNKAMKIAEEINNPGVKETVLSSFSEVYSDKNMMKEALDYGNRALKLAITLNDSVEIGRCYYYLSVYYDKLGNTNNSLELKLKYLELLERIDNKAGQVNDLHSIGELYYKDGNYSKARDYFSRSLSLAEEINYLRFIAKSSFNLSEASYALGKYKEASDYLRKYVEASDSLFSEESKKKLQTLQIKYETEKKERENADLKERNSFQLKYFIIILALTLLMSALLFNRYVSRKKSLRLISRKNAEIESANEELKKMNERITDQNARLEYLNKDLLEANASKDKFFLILSHELLNPIRWLNNVSNLLIDRLDRMDKNELREVAELLGNSAKESNLLLENLLLWAKIHTDRIKLAPEELCLCSAINENVDLVKARLQDKNITVEVEASDEEIAYADKVMLDTILRNLINNAIKFSNPGGHIKIMTLKNNGFVNITVSDDGVGIRPEDVDKLFRIDVHYTTLGTSKEKGTGLGLILCKEYLERIGCEICVESQFKHGSKFSFSVPVCNIKAETTF